MSLLSKVGIRDVRKLIQVSSVMSFAMDDPLEITPKTQVSQLSCLITASKPLPLRCFRRAHPRGYACRNFSRGITTQSEPCFSFFASQSS